MLLVNVPVSFCVTGSCPFNPERKFSTCPKRCLWPLVFRFRLKWVILMIYNHPSEPQTSDSGQIQLYESMVDDSSEVYAFLCCLYESVFEKRNTHQPIHRNRVTGLPKLIKGVEERGGEELWWKNN